MADSPTLASDSPPYDDTKLEPEVTEDKTTLQDLPSCSKTALQPSAKSSWQCAFHASEASSIFFQPPSGVWRIRVPVSAQSGHFDIGRWNKWEVAASGCVAFCDNGGVFAAYVSQDCSTFSWKLIRNEPRRRSSFGITTNRRQLKTWRESAVKLNKYLQDNLNDKRDVATIRLIFRHGAGWYAWSPKGGAAWYGLPSLCEQSLQEYIKEGCDLSECSLTFGVHDTWLITRKSGRWTGTLGGKYSELAQILEEHKEIDGGIEVNAEQCHCCTLL